MGGGGGAASLISLGGGTYFWAAVGVALACGGGTALLLLQRRRRQQQLLVLQRQKVSKGGQGALRGKGGLRERGLVENPLRSKLQQPPRPPQGRPPVHAFQSFQQLHGGKGGGAARAEDSLEIGAGRRAFIRGGHQQQQGDH